MFIDSIILNNYRIYKGQNVVNFSHSNKNIFLIAGNNGYGKTTFLTSLIWCLYGKLMVDVDEKYRRDINDNQGYKNYAKANLNQNCKTSLQQVDLPIDIKKIINKNGYTGKYEALKDLSQYSVEINFSNIYIPSIPCQTLSVKRTYDILCESETVEVFIDGQTNELAKDVGYDIFINDFILSKDIAKFFFFDAEKIVNLAEVKSTEEKRRLSIAYSEVLGIKKYEDIKKNLENLRLKYRKNSGSNISKNKLDKLIAEVQDAENEINKLNQSIEIDENKLTELIKEKDELQEKLIREGNAMSITELNKQKELLNSLKKKYESQKNQLKDMLDVAPFAISGNVFIKLHTQIENEYKQQNKTVNQQEIYKTLLQTKDELFKEMSNFPLSMTEDFKNAISSYFETKISQINLQESADAKILLDYSKEQRNEFNSLFDNIKYSYSLIFKQLIKDMKNTNIFMLKTQKKIAAAEYNNDDKEIIELRNSKAAKEQQIDDIHDSIKAAAEQVGTISKDLAIKKKQLSTMLKNIDVDNNDKEKDAIAARLIDELNEFLIKLKNKRKSSLASKIKSEIDILMHKEHFIKSIRIDLTEHIIDINLIDFEDRIINKEILSKGEQQLYATAILKALVDESGIDFPVFIDSPLQKFDSIHSKNIITKFYPSISKQVVIFPLLGKELSKAEYKDLLPNVNRSYSICNNEEYSSLKEIEPTRIFETIQ